MRRMRNLGGFAGALVVAGTLVLVGTSAAAPSRGAPAGHQLWAQQRLAGTHVFTGQVPLVVTGRRAGPLRAHDPASKLTINFGFPLRNKAALDRLIARQAKTHSHLSRATALRAVLASAGAGHRARQVADGARLPHHACRRRSAESRRQGADVHRAEDAARPDQGLRTARVHVPGREGRAVRVLLEHDGAEPARALRRADHLGPDRHRPLLHRLPARARRQGCAEGLAACAAVATSRSTCAGSTTSPATASTAPARRSASRCGRFRERQAAMNTFATDDRRPARSRSTRPASATGNSPTTPSSCSTQTVAADHLLHILENGNTDTNNNFGSNVETALDIEAAHGVATHVGDEVLRLRVRAPRPPANSGLANAGCNGTDVGMEMAMEDAANDPTLHSVSNSWAYGGEAEWGITDPFVVATEQHPRARRGGRDDLLLLDRRLRHVPVRLPDRQPVRRRRRRHEHLLDEHSGHVEHDARRGAAAAAGARTSSPGRRGRPAPASRPTRRARAASSRTSRRSPTRTRASASRPART